MPSFTSLISLALISSTALALPSSFSNLVPRNIDFQPSRKALDYTRAVECTAEQRAVIAGTLNDATTLAAVARYIEIWSPAYRAYFDRNAPRSKSQAKGASQRQISMFNTVKERFDRAYQLLTDPKTPTIPILCDPALGHDVSQVPKNKIVCPDGVVAKTNNYRSFSAIIICKPFFERVKAKGGLSAYVTDFDGRKINMCENPTQLQAATNSAKVLFHEIMHLHKVAPMFDENEQRNDIIDCVYGAFLNSHIAKYSPKATLANADSYAYAALSHYLNMICNDPKTMYYQSEPEYPRHHLPENMPMGGMNHYNRCMLPYNAPNINLNNPFKLDLSSLGIPDAGKFKLLTEPVGLSPGTGLERTSNDPSVAGSEPRQPRIGV